MSDVFFQCVKYTQHLFPTHSTARKTHKASPILIKKSQGFKSALFLLGEFVDAFITTQYTFSEARIIPTDLCKSKILHWITANPSPRINESNFVYSIASIAMNKIIVAASITVEKSGSKRSEQMIRKEMRDKEE